MVNTKEFVDKLVNKYNVEEFCGVSDSTLKYLINEVSNRDMYIPFTNEGDAVAYAAGRTASGHKTVVLMQNSGLTNASSPISSLTSLYKIPVMYIVGWRGKPLTKDEPQHQIIGANTLSIIKSITDSAISLATIKKDGDLDFGNDLPYKGDQIFILVDPRTFDKVELKNFTYKEDEIHLDRLECIKLIKNHSDKDTFFLSTTGFTSRELMSLNEKDFHNFYMLGSMGCIVPFTFGIAKSHLSKKFIILDGDGSFLMRPEASYICNLMDNMDNVLHIIFNNNSHLSTGGQYIPSEEIVNIYQSICNRTKVVEIDSFEILMKQLVSWFEYPERTTIIIKTLSNFNNDLPRPESTPKEILDNFKKGLNE